MSDEIVEFADNPYQSPRSSRGGTSRRSAKTSRSKDRVYVFKSVRVLGMILMVLFALAIITSVGVLAVHKGPLQALLSVLFVESLLTLALGIVFIVWFYKAYVNLPPLGVKKLDPSAGWAIGGWFVPFFSWYQPYVISKEIWINSCPVDAGKIGRARRKPSTAPVLVWWLLWVSINIMRVMFRSSVEPGAGGALGSSSNILILETLRILAAVGAIYFVHTVSTWQDKRYELLSELAEEQPVAEAPDESNPYENYS